MDIAPSRLGSKKKVIIESKRWERHYEAARPYIVLIDGCVLMGKKGPRTFGSEEAAIKAAQRHIENTKEK